MLLLFNQPIQICFEQEATEEAEKRGHSQYSPFPPVQNPVLNFGSTEAATSN
jgi:hypothetical protein